MAFYTSWLNLPWVIKPLWSPIVDLLQTRRLWIWIVQLLFGAGFAGVALTIHATHFFQYTLACLWLLAFSSATHDIAADGFYMLALSERDQAFFVGIRSTLYRTAMLAGQGGLVIFAGLMEERTGSSVFAWSAAFGLMSVLLVGLGLYHSFILPRPEADRPGSAGSFDRFFKEFFLTFGSFFRKPKIGLLLLFLLFYRFGEAQLSKMTQLFLLDPVAKGGLGLTTEQVGSIYGTLGLVALLAGGLLGGLVASRQGLKFWLWPMVLAINLPDTVYVYLAAAQPHSLSIISSCAVVEMFGYGFGFTAYMLYMIYIARGPHQTAHYAICTGFMALGMMVPGMWSGWLQEKFGYPHFFIWVLAATSLSFLATALIPLDAEFGKKR
ncbi:MAG TPA: MFS transporter [Verrucomicrobiae bacterium]|nr:MFS transporter [Verrucomicrobiae bacterium]